MKRLLCYGDSNTWGYVPGTGDRFPRGVRWPSVLQTQLESEWLVIEEGLNGRTTGLDDPIDSSRNGMRSLPPILSQHHPLDAILLMLGTNDLKAIFASSAGEIAGRISTLVKTSQELGRTHHGGQPEVVIMAPPPLGELRGEIAVEFAGGNAKSLAFAAEYRRIADSHGTPFFDVSQAVKTSSIDGVHFEAEDHLRLGEAMAAFFEGSFS